MRLKRYCMPKTWRLERKTHTWSSVQRGPHSRENSMPFLIVVRDLLKLADTGKEARKIIKEGKILVDKKEMKDHKFSVGLMDVLEIPEMKKSFRMIRDSLGLKVVEVKGEKASQKLCRINGKRTVKGGMTQLNLHDGRNILIKGGKTYSPNDSVVISLPDQKVVKHFKMEKGAPAMVLAGRSAGSEGRIKDIRQRKNMLEKSTIILESKDKEILTPLEYVMVGEV